VSRAVRTSHALSEPIDPAQDASLCHPDSSVRCTYGVSAPIAVQGERATALCAGLAAAPAGSHANVLWVVAAYARLASLRLAKHGQPLFANGRDAVTGCLTYPAVLETLADELARCAMTDRDIACCFVSIEAIGGGEGSEFLATAGRMLLGLIGEGDCVGRYGRAQFIVVLPGSDLRGAIRMGKGIRASFESASGVDARVGVAQWVPGTGADRLLGDADRSLAAARNGRKRKEAAARA
jgi:GGDEF domain-containing protein